MQSFIENHEAAIRLSAFVGMLVVMGLWETLAPRRVLALPRWLRWFNNLGLVVLNTLMLRLLCLLWLRLLISFFLINGSVLQ